MPTVKDSQFHSLPQRQQVGSILIRMLTFVLSTLGLLFMVCSYSVIGGFVFQWLEASNERTSKLNAREKVNALTQQFTIEIYKVLEKSQIEDDAATTRRDQLTQIEIRVKSFTLQCFKLTKEGFWDGTFHDDGEVVLDWTFTGALLFSVTTIATIGYGYIAPRTTTGRITLIFYAVFGIPITMLCVASIGLWFAKQVRLMHRKLSARCRKSTTSQVQEVPVLFSLITLACYVLLGAAIFSSWENWTLTDGAYFSFVTLATIGFGDIVPDVYTGKGEWSGFASSSKKQFKLVICGFYLFFGLALLAMCMDLMKEEVRANFVWLGQKLGLVPGKRKKT